MNPDGVREMLLNNFQGVASTEPMRPLSEARREPLSPTAIQITRVWMDHEGLAVF